MKTILLEIRDRATFIPVFATLMEPTNGGNAYLLRRAGFGLGSNLVMLGRCDSGKFVIFEGANAKADCKVFITAVGGVLEQ